MTCVVGVEKDGAVWLAGDSACLDVEGDAVVTQRQSKVFRRGPYCIGFSGSFRIGNLFKYDLKLPNTLSSNHPRQISEELIKVIEKHQLKEEDWSALIGYKDKLYIVQSDCYCYRHTKPYAAIGAESAVAVALGTFCTIESLQLQLKEQMSGKAILKMALENATTFSSNVRPPWKFTKTM